MSGSGTENLFDVESIYSRVLHNPCLPYFFVSLVNNNYMDFCRFLGLNGELKELAEDTKDYIYRLKDLKAHYTNCYYSTLKDFLSDIENLEMVLIYFVKSFAGKFNSNYMYVLIFLDNYLNFGAFNNY